MTPSMAYWLTFWAVAVITLAIFLRGPTRAWRRKRKYRTQMAEAARGMTTRFDTETYGTFGIHPAFTGVQIEPIAPTQAPQRKYGPRN